MKKLALAALATVSAATLAISGGSILSAQSSGLPGTVDVSRVTAGTYKLDPAHTLVNWRVDHFGFNDYFGIFGDIEGTMTLDPANIGDTEFEIMVPISKVTVASAGLKEHFFRPGKDGAAPDFFGPEPGMAKFTSTSVRRASDTTAVVSGMLDMNGKSGPVTMRVEFTGAGTNPFTQAETVGFEARAIIDRTQWDVSYDPGLVGKDVELTISAGFERQ